jgi:uncharacterized membrane protein
MRQEKPYRRIDSGTPKAAEFYLVPTLAIAFLTAFAVVIVLVPPELVLPALSIVALAGAAAIGVSAYLSPRLASLKPINGWDIAGALTFIGCAAAVMGEIEPVVEYFKLIPERSPSRG